MKPNLIIPEHSTKYFHYDVNDKTFTCEVSDLNLRAGNGAGSWQGGVFDRIYDDACDVGFWLVSHKTGQKKLFYWFKEDRSPEGELYGIWFENDEGFKVLVIND